MSTVELEVQDNLYLVLQQFQLKAAGQQPRLVLDNIRIQANVSDEQINSRYGVLDLPPGTRIRIPAHSPDCNQVVEHAISAVKDDITGQLYEQSIKNPVITGDKLRSMGVTTFRRFEKGEIYRGAIKANVEKLPDVWGVIATPTDEEYIVTTSVLLQHTKVCHGTGGDWAPPGWN